MRFEWQGFYLDGRSAERQRVKIYLGSEGLEIRPDQGQSHRLLYRNLKQTQGFYSGEQVRLEWGEDLPQALLVSDINFLTNLHRLTSGRYKHLHNPANRSTRLRYTFLASVGAVVLSILIYFLGIPALSSVVIPYVPVSWEERLGSSALEHLAPPENRCDDPEKLRAIREILAALIAPLEESPYSFEITVVDLPLVNALAAPGGYIVIYRGLLEETESAEELAGVLAHESQHILKRHTTRALLQRASTRILLAALSGDATGATMFGLESAGTLGMLQYNRRAESEADFEGLLMMINAGIDPQGMVSFFESLKENHAGLPEILTYISTHPGTTDRIDQLNMQISKADYPTPQKLFSDEEWKKIKMLCEISGDEIEPS